VIGYHSNTNTNTGHLGTEHLNLPENFKVEVFASDVAFARQMVILMSNWLVGNVYVRC
jgi:hypothetical protein